MFKHVLVAVDGSAHADHAIERAADLALRYQAKLTALHVVRHPHVREALEELGELERIEHVEFNEHDVLELAAKKIKVAAEKQIRHIGVPNVEMAVLRGSPAEQIIGYVEDHGVDLVVIGTRGLSDLPGLLLGSVSHQVIHLSRVPVLAVP